MRERDTMKSVLVTGGTVRLGAAIAARLRAEGWRVITSSHRADAGADIVADLAEPLGPAKLFAAALRLLGGTPPDALVNNAALFVGDEAAIAAVNLEAPKKLTMLMAGRESGVGAVVNILDSVILGSVGSVGSVGSIESIGSIGAVGSVGAVVAVVAVGSVGSVGPVPADAKAPSAPEDSKDSSAPEDSKDSSAPEDSKDSKDPKRPYLSSKRELRAFTLSSAATFAATLRVNGVAPGPVMAPTEVHEKAGEMLLDRRPTADDVAAAVAYLLSAEATTGTIIPVDAGQHLLEG